MFFFSLVSLRSPSRPFVLYAGFRIPHHFRVAPSPVRRHISPANGILILWRSDSSTEARAFIIRVGAAMRAALLEVSFTYIIYLSSIICATSILH